MEIPTATLFFLPAWGSNWGYSSFCCDQTDRDLSGANWCMCHLYLLRSELELTREKLLCAWDYPTHVQRSWAHFVCICFSVCGQQGLEYPWLDLQCSCSWKLCVICFEIYREYNCTKIIHAFHFCIFSGSLIQIAAACALCISNKQNVWIYSSILLLVVWLLYKETLQLKAYSLMLNRGRSENCQNLNFLHIFVALL